MEVILNGTKIATSAATLAELIAEQGASSAGTAVAVGTRIVRRADWEHTPLEEGAEITLIRATQGG